MNYMKILKSIMFIMVIYVGTLHSQANKIEIIKTNKDVEFKIEMIDSLYNPNDTIEITYSVKNKTKYPLYIFDPHNYYYGVYKIEISDSLCSCDFDLGREWLYDPGWNYRVSLIMIPAFDDYCYRFKILSEITPQNKYCYYNDANFNFKEYFTYYMKFSIGYFLNDKEINLKNKDEDGLVVFKNMVDANIFETYMKRFNLGQLPISILK